MLNILNMIKKYWWLVLSIISALSVLWGLLKPPIEQIKFISHVDTTMVDKLKIDIDRLTTQNSIITKQLTTSKELNKNINTHEEYYPDGKLKSRDIIDKSTFTSATSVTTTNTVYITIKEKDTVDHSTSTHIVSNTTENKTTSAVPVFELYGGLGFKTLDNFVPSDVVIQGRFDLFGIKFSLQEQYDFLINTEFKNRFKTILLINIL
jgi:hypothetical protein